MRSGGSLSPSRLRGRIRGSYIAWIAATRWYRETRGREHRYQHDKERPFKASLVTP